MTSEVTFNDEMDVRLRKQLASDEDVIEAMLVSTRGEDTEAFIAAEGPAGIKGRINWLMREKHGSPFEHNYFKFFVKVPIFVVREHHRHRIGFSYNEGSGRYSIMKPEFYIPPRERNLVQVGKPGSYTFQPGSAAQYEEMVARHKRTASVAYANYQHLLSSGVAGEVARMTLPLNIYTSQYISMNARSMMAFLSLRQFHPDATFPSNPMKEINQVADIYEQALKRSMPMTHKAFVNNGRVCP